MNFINSFFKENRSLFFSVVIVWICASVVGIVFGSKVADEGFAALSQNITTSLSQPLETKDAVFHALGLKLLLLAYVIIASASPILSPAIYVSDAFEGFSSGLGCALIMRIFSLKGSLVNLIIYVIPLSVSLPLYFMLFVTGLKFSLSPRENILHEKVATRRKQWLSYILLQGALVLLLFFAEVAEAFLCKGITTFLN